MPKKPDQMLRNVFRKVDISHKSRPAIHLLVMLKEKVKSLPISKKKKEELFSYVRKWARSGLWFLGRLPERGILAKKLIPYVDDAIRFLKNEYFTARNKALKQLLSEKIESIEKLRRKLISNKNKYVYFSSSGRKSGILIEDALLQEVLNLSSTFYLKKMEALHPDLENLLNIPKTQKHLVRGNLAMQGFYINAAIAKFDPYADEGIMYMVNEIKSSLYKKSRFTFYDAEHIAKVLAPVLASYMYKLLEEKKVIKSQNFRKKLIDMTTVSFLALTALHYRYISKTSLENMVAILKKHKAFSESFDLEMLKGPLKSKEKNFDVYKNNIIKEFCEFASTVLERIIVRYLPAASGVGFVMVYNFENLQTKLMKRNI